MLDDQDEFERGCLVPSVRAGLVSIETAQSFINELKQLQQERSLNNNWDEVLATIAPQNLEDALKGWIEGRRQREKTEQDWWLTVGSFV